MKTNNCDHGKFAAPGEIRFVRELPGPIERVWDYLTDAGKRSRWLATGTMELRVGGKVHLEFHHADLTLPPHLEEIPDKDQEPCTTGSEACNLTGRVTRCEPPRLLSFTWGEMGDSEVSFELTPQADRVQLVLTHRKLGDDRAMLTGVAAGWHTHMAIMIAKLEGTPPPPFWSTHSKLEAEYERQLTGQTAPHPTP